MAEMTAAQAAEVVGTDARTLRKFLRDSPHYEAVGQGRRYAFDEDDIAALQQRFGTWQPKPSSSSSAQDDAETSALDEDDLTDLDDVLDLDDAL